VIWRNLSALEWMRLKKAIIDFDGCDKHFQEQSYFPQALCIANIVPYLIDSAPFFLRVKLSPLLCDIFKATVVFNITY